MKTKIISGTLLAALVGPIVAAQEARQEQIIVTATRIDADFERSMPHIRLRVPADFVLFEASFINGDLDIEKRKADLSATYGRVIAADNRREDIEIVIGDADQSYPVQTTTFDEAYQNYGQRGVFELALRVDANEGETYEMVRARAETFLEGIRKSGLVQYYVDDEQYIGLRDPERFRPDLVEAISEEVNLLGGAFGASKVTITGLDQRTVTQPTGALSLDVYIPYTLVIVK